MDIKGSSSICRTCRKEVLVDNLALHESHCGRFLCLCPDCGETVSREQLEQHRLEEHSQIKCPGCDQQMECRSLVDHKVEECTARLLCCDFCELELPVRRLEEHRLVCGSRTEHCNICHRYVLLRNLAQHALACPAAAGPAATAGPPPSIRHPHPPPTNAMTPGKTDVICISCLGFFPAEDLEEHKLGCALTSAWIEEEEGDGLLPCSYCQLLLPRVTLRWHEPKCRIHLFMK